MIQSHFFLNLISLLAVIYIELSHKDHEVNKYDYYPEKLETAMVIAHSKDLNSRVVSKKCDWISEVCKHV